MLFASIETVIIALFLLAVADAVWNFKKDKKKLLLLGLAFIYSLIFENFNIILSKVTYENQVYSKAFAINIGFTPLVIIMAWSVIIYTAMHLSDMLNLKMMVKPFMDALLVLTIHLTLGVVAIRQGLWTWIDTSPTHGWFGVPADNLIAWMLIVFMFSFLFRHFTRTNDDLINKTTRTEYFFLLPAFAYLGMLVLFSLVNLAEDLLALTKSQELFILFALVILFALMLRSPDHKNKSKILYVDALTILVILITRLVLLTYLIWSIVFMDIYLENVTIAIILIGSLIAEVMIYHSAFGKIGGDVLAKYKDKTMRHY